MEKAEFNQGDGKTRRIIERLRYECLEARCGRTHLLEPFTLCKDDCHLVKESINIFGVDVI